MAGICFTVGRKAYLTHPPTHAHFCCLTFVSFSCGCRRRRSSSPTTLLFRKGMDLCHGEERLTSPPQPHPRPLLFFDLRFLFLRLQEMPLFLTFNVALIRKGMDLSHGGEGLTDKHNYDRQTGKWKEMAMDVKYVRVYQVRLFSSLQHTLSLSHTQTHTSSHTHNFTHAHACSHTTTARPASGRRWRWTLKSPCVPGEALLFP
jgi:hypothetical protein